MHDIFHKKKQKRGRAKKTTYQGHTNSNQSILAEVLKCAGYPPSVSTDNELLIKKLTS